MMQNRWKLLPELLVHKINDLLLNAEPNQIKAFQLYKNCKSENLWRNSFELFTVHLTDFYSTPYRQRSKSYFDQFLDRPMGQYLYEDFQLNFHTAYVSPKPISDIAIWMNREISCLNISQHVITSVEVLTKTIQYITNPPRYEKNHDLNFEDFCNAWKKTIFFMFGKIYDNDYQKIMAEIQEINTIKKPHEIEDKKSKFEIYLTQTEIDWTINIYNSLSHSKNLPKFPLTRGPEKERLKQLERACQLYNLVSKSSKVEITKYKQSVYNTILDHCNWLLKSYRR